MNVDLLNKKNDAAQEQSPPGSAGQLVTRGINLTAIPNVSQNWGIWSPHCVRAKMVFPFSGQSFWDIKLFISRDCRLKFLFHWPHVHIQTHSSHGTICNLNKTCQATEARSYEFESSQQCCAKHERVVLWDVWWLVTCASKQFHLSKYFMILQATCVHGGPPCSSSN